MRKMPKLEKRKKPTKFKRNDIYKRCQNGNVQNLQKIQKIQKRLSLKKQIHRAQKIQKQAKHTKLAKHAKHTNAKITEHTKSKK